MKFGFDWPMVSEEKTFEGCGQPTMDRQQSLPILQAHR